MSTQAEIVFDQIPYFLHLVRIDDLEYYFFEIEDAIAKLTEEPEAEYERITIH